MGSGKTTLGRLLAAQARAAFVDLDAHVEWLAQRSIAEVFERHGEHAFRDYELRALRDIVAAPPGRAVIATGGGVVENQTARDLVRGLGTIVWLRADPEASVQRLCPKSRAARPLLAANWRRRWARREPLYAALADHVVSTHPEPVEASLAVLVKLLRLATE
jgi:shikimate kinase